VEYHQAVDASMEILHQLKIPPIESIADELKTDIKATRPDGTPVMVEVERMRPNRTQISIRTGTIGVLDRPTSTQLHEFIERKLIHVPEIVAKPPDYDLSGHPKAYPRQQNQEKTQLKKISPALASRSGYLAEKSFPKDLSLFTLDAEKPANTKFIIFFQQDSNKLQEKAIEKLGEIISMINENPDAQLMITGFPDSKGSAIYKRMLSERRANTIKLYLVANGMNPSRSQIVVQNTPADLPHQGAIIEVAHR
jgi:outer membrane protein OmpA-like peptidoglycan-associated protein